jgi:hypothetical protein
MGSIVADLWEIGRFTPYRLHFLSVLFSPGPVSQSFASVLTTIGHKTTTNTPVPAIDGIDVSGDLLLYTTRIGEPPDPGFSATLSRLDKKRSSSVVADTWAYEQAANPDKVNSYGFTSISPTCAAQVPAEAGPAQYKGQLDSHPYGVAIAKDRTYIADAGSNDILEVSRFGRVRAIAVLPPQPTVVTAEAAAANGLPACAIGLTYNFEPMPTDVEIGGRHVVCDHPARRPRGPEPRCPRRGLEDQPADRQRASTGRWVPRCHQPGHRPGWNDLCV